MIDDWRDKILESYERDYIENLSRLIEIQNKIKHIHPLFVNYYPVTIVNNNTFEIYDVISDKKEYKFIKSEPCPVTIPAGVRAAFPLDCYDNKMSAIVSSGVFDTLKGYVAILHEFVHCAQWMECEAEIKDQLRISHEYKEKNDYMWELNHPFPYKNQSFIELYSKYMDALMKTDFTEIIYLRQQFKIVLGDIDIEYLLWQEWKEGFARFLENKIRKQLNIEENHFGNQMPFGRVSFYESGSLFISTIEKINSSSLIDMRKLFYEMRGSII